MTRKHLQRQALTPTIVNKEILKIESTNNYVDLSRDIFLLTWHSVIMICYDYVDNGRIQLYCKTLEIKCDQFCEKGSYT